MVKTTTIQISKETHSKLVAFKAYLTLQRNKESTMDDAILELLEIAGSERFKRGLETEK